jgi:hypothetical protein
MTTSSTSIKSKTNSPSEPFAKRIPIPTQQRIIQLLALNIHFQEIAKITSSEFKEILGTPISYRDVKRVDDANKPQIEQMILDIKQRCNTDIVEHSAQLFQRVASAEQELVQVFSDKLKEALSSLSSLDLNEQDESGKFINTNRTFQLLELIDKYHSKASKVIGTEALREIEIFRTKAQIKRTEEEKSINLIPIHNKESTTRFL